MHPIESVLARFPSCLPALAGLAALASASLQPAAAQITTYTDEASWESAVSDRALIDFDDFTGPVANQYPGVAFGPWNQGVPIALTGYSGLSPATIDGSGFMLSAYGVGYGGRGWTTDFSPPVQGLGFWTGDLQFAGSTVELFDDQGALLGSFDLLAVAGVPGQGLWLFTGFASAQTDIARVEVAINHSDYVIHDRFQFGPAGLPPPVEPPSGCTLPAGLVSWWSFEADAGDRVGPNDGVQLGGAFAPGQVGNAYEPSGGNIDVADDASLDLDELTIETWIRVDANSSKNQVGVWKGDSGGANVTSPYFLGVTLGTARPLVGLGTGASYQVASGSVLPLGVWTHVALTVDANWLQLYLNGAPDGTHVRSVGTLVNSGYPLRIGGHPFLPLNQLRGALDELSLYDRALTPAEIQALFDAGSEGKCRDCGPVPDGLVSWWDGDAVAGVTASDVGGANDGTLQNGATTAAGRVGQAFDFDGVDDVVEIANESAFDFDRTSSFTIEAWVQSTPKTAGDQMVFSKSGQPDQYRGYYVFLNDTANDAVGFILQRNGTDYTYVRSTTDVIDGAWHHIAAVHDGGLGGTAAGVRIYVDGSEEATSVLRDNLGTVSILNDFAPRIGGRHPAPDPSDVEFQGQIDELAVYDRALTAQEILGIYTALGEGKCQAVDTPPTADAGADFSVNEGQAAVMLDGSGSDLDGDPLTFAWAQLPGGTPVALSDLAAPQPTFDAPLVASGGETLGFELTVTANGVSASDTVNVSIVNVNHPPVADAGLDQSIAEGSPVTLHGEDSFDVDLDLFGYAWVQVGGSPTVSLAGASTANPSFTAPYVAAGGAPGVVATLVFELTVDDGFAPDAPAPGFDLEDVTDSVTVEITNLNNDPSAAAGGDQTVDENTAVTLNGIASSDPDSDALTYAWAQIAGVGVVLSGDTTTTPSFTAPFVNPGGGDLTFELTVDDGYGGTASDSVVVHVQNANDPPLVSAARPTVSVLWPPNHKLVSVGITGVSDPDDNATITIDGVTQDEATNGLGDGDTGIDAIINADGTVLLRAERAGGGNGRVYHIHFTASDLEGSASGVVTVSVPHDKKGTAVDDGELHDSTS